MPQPPGLPMSVPLPNCEAPRRAAITVRGVVQGVGFRPFVYHAARSRGLAGWVQNEADLVRIEVRGEPAAVVGVPRGPAARRPAAGPRRRDRRDRVWPPATADGLATFQIRASAAGAAAAADHCRPTWPPARPAWPRSATRPSGAIAIRSPTARTAARGGRSSASCPTIGRGPRWPASPCAPRARPNTTTRPTGVSTPSRSPARRAARNWNCCDADGQTAGRRAGRTGGGRRGAAGRPDRGPQRAGRFPIAGRCDQRRRPWPGCASGSSGPHRPLAVMFPSLGAAQSICEISDDGGPGARCRPRPRSCCCGERARSAGSAAASCRHGRRRRPGQSVPGRHAPLHAAAPPAHGRRGPAAGLHQRESVGRADGDRDGRRPAAARSDRRLLADPRSADRPAGRRFGGPAGARRVSKCSAAPAATPRCRSRCRRLRRRRSWPWAGI